MTKTVLVTYKSAIGNRTPTSTSPTMKSPPMVLVTETGDRITLPVGPQMSRDGYGIVFDQYERLGRKPILAARGKGLKALTFTLMVLGRGNDGVFDYTVPVSALVEQIRTVARLGQKVRIENYNEPGWYYITAISDEDAMYAPPLNAVTRSSIAITLTEVSDAVIKVGPLTGGATTTPAAAVSDTAASSPAAGGGTERPKVYYTVVSGDTFWKIAQKFYGDGERWPEIADANKITDPRRLSVGTKLEIPPK